MNHDAPAYGLWSLAVVNTAFFVFFAASFTVGGWRRLRPITKPTVKQHLAAIRMLFDWLVTGAILASNPATSVRGLKHVIKRGKTPVLTTDQARMLIESIDTSTLGRPA